MRVLALVAPIRATCTRPAADTRRGAAEEFTAELLDWPARTREALPVDPVISETRKANGR
jgi:hypothetical protein